MHTPSDRSVDSGQDGITVERRSPEAVFALLGDDIRAGIVQALGETPDERVPFAELRERVGVRDSGQFNYHLGKLRGVLVRRTDEGYELTHAGRQILGAIYAGTYTANATVEPIAVAEPCPICGGALVAAYADEVATVHCRDCDDFRDESSFPPGSLDQFDRAELPYAFDRWTHHRFAGVIAGFCGTCGGRMEGRLIRDEEGWAGGMPAHAEFGCSRCGSTAYSSAATPVLFHPATQGFLHDHGFDARTSPSWLLTEVAVPEVSVVSEDPLEVEVVLTHGEEAVTATVGSDARISDIERTTSRG